MRNYTPQWIDKERYTAIMSAVCSYPRYNKMLYRERSKPPELQNMNKIYDLICKTAPIRAALSEFDTTETELINQRFWQRKKFRDIHLPMCDTGMRKKCKEFLILVGTMMDEI